MKYEIRYKHRSSELASSKAAALRSVRMEARVSRLAIAKSPDGTLRCYCYRTCADKDRDDTGARAYAVICARTTQAQRLAEKTQTHEQHDEHPN